MIVTDTGGRRPNSHRHNSPSQQSLPAPRAHWKLCPTRQQSSMLGHGGDLGSAPMNPTTFPKNMARQAQSHGTFSMQGPPATLPAQGKRDQEAPRIKANCSQHASPSLPSARNTVKGMAPKSWCFSQGSFLTSSHTIHSLNIPDLWADRTIRFKAMPRFYLHLMRKTSSCL